MRARFIVASVLVGSSLLACSAIGGENADTLESAHTEGEPTFAQHPWQWADETEDEFRRNADTGSRGPATFLPADHPMAQRLHYWLDRMDTALRAAYPEKLRATPRPQILIRKTTETNAWVSFMPITWNVPTRYAAPPRAVEAGSDSGEAGAEGGVAADPAVARELMLSRSGSVEARNKDGFARPHDARELGELTRFFNDNFARCKLSLEGEVLVLGDGCTQGGGGDAKRADRFAYYATAKYVTFTSGYLLQLLDEDRVVSTLAHELGHYYRSHANMPTDVVNYFYSLDQAHAHKPPPDPRFIEQTAKAREKLRGGAFGGWREENALMSERGVGFYTIEQEADELALELMAKVGIPGGVAIDKVLTILKASGERGGESNADAIPWAQCSQLREQGFKDAEGKTVSVPVGDPSNAHHNLCFRVFNMHRELAAHRYSLAQRPSPPGEPWSRLLTRLAADVDPLPEPPSPPAGDSGAPGAPDASAPSDAGTD